MIHVHHARRARSGRVLRLLEELGVQVESVEFEYEKLRWAEYRKIRPLGLGLVLIDGDLSYGMVMPRITREIPDDLVNVAGYLVRLEERPA